TEAAPAGSVELPESDTTIAPPIAYVTTQDPVAAARKPFPWLETLVGVWFLGSVFWFALAAVRTVRFGRLLRGAELAPERLQAAAEAFAHVAPPSDDRGAIAGRDHGVGTVHAWTITRNTPATRTGLTLWMDLMAAYRGSEVLRMKGVINVAGRPVAVESIRHVFHPPVDLAGWPDDDQRTRVVVIAGGIDRKSIEEAFGALFFKPVSKPLDCQAYRRFQDVMNRMRSG
ncbi:MAG: GTP-binding protein, partial [Pseudomonadota bacterium]